MHVFPCTGCDPDPAGEAVNQMHRTLLSGAGAADRGIGQQAASPARAGDAFSGRRRFFFFPPFSLSDTHICSVFKQQSASRCHLSAPAQQERRLTLHLLRTHTRIPL